MRTALVLGALLVLGFVTLAKDGSVAWPMVNEDVEAITISPQGTPPRDWFCEYKWRCGEDLTWWYICCYGMRCERGIILPIVGPICFEWRYAYECGCFPPWAIPYSEGEVVLNY